MINPRDKRIYNMFEFTIFFIIKKVKMLYIDKVYELFLQLFQENQHR